VSIMRASCVVVCLVVSAGAASAETSRPFRTLFTAPPIEAPPIGDVSLPQDEGSLLGAPGPDLAAAAQTPAQKPPEPGHTGVSALVHTTASDFIAFPQRRSTWVILGIGAAAALAAHPADDSINDHFAGSSGAGKFFAAGKYIGNFYVQLGTASGLYVIGRYILPENEKEGEGRTNKVSHLGFDLVRALVVSQALTMATKYAVQRDRPTGECCAFPSGHASATFAFASVLERHLGYRGAWPTFVVASYVAASRLHDNRHFLSDVLFGSALGMASGWTVVGRHGRNNYAMMPLPTRGGMMIAVTYNPHRAESRAPRAASVSPGTPEVH